MVAHASTTLCRYPGFLMPPYADNNGSGDAGNWRGTAPPSILTPRAPSPFVVPSNSKLSTPCRQHAAQLFVKIRPISVQFTTFFLLRLVRKPQQKYCLNVATAALKKN